MLLWHYCITCLFVWPGKSLPNNIITIAISLEHIPHMLILYIATHVHNYIEPDDHKVSFAHEQKRHGLQWTWSIGVATVANKGTVTVFVMLVGHDNSRHIYAQIFHRLTMTGSFFYELLLLRNYNRH